MAAAGGALLLWLSWPSTRTASNLAFVVAVFCALTAIAIANPSGSSPVTRLAQVASPTAQSGGSLQDRVTLAQQAWPRIRSDPIVGAGLDTGDSFLTIISHTSEAYYQLHGLPLAAWYQGGIFALLGLLGVLMAQAVLGWRGVRAAADPADAVLGLALLGAFLAFVVEAMTMPLVFQQYSWAAAALLFAWSSQVAMSRRAVELETEAGAVKARGAFASSMPLAATLSDLRT
jgi:hypothetical protein